MRSYLQRETRVAVDKRIHSPLYIGAAQWLSTVSNILLGIQAYCNKRFLHLLHLYLRRYLHVSNGNERD